MERFEIRTLLESDISRAAHYVVGWHASRPGEVPQNRTQSSVERRLRWLVLENPIAGDGPFGYYVQDESGRMTGLILCFPNAFVVDDSRCVGLCSGSFFVETSARMQGFFLFRRYLGNSSRDFFFGTTCNANSGALWSRLGAEAVPHSEFEYIFPLNLQVMIPAYCVDKDLGNGALTFGKVTGRVAGACLKPFRRMKTGLSVEPCKDWDKLAALFYRYRSREWLTTERSPEFLQWRYGPGSPDCSADVFAFRDKNGNEGWFSLASTTRGRHGQIRGIQVLDAVWPRARIEFRQILAAILELPNARSADALFLRPRLGVDYSRSSRLLFPRRLEGPSCFVLAGQNSVPVSALDLVAADGDSGF